MNVRISLVMVVALAAILMAGCSQAAPTPAPTAAPAAPKPAEPTKAAAPAAPTAAPAAPTAVPKPKVVYPEKGRAVTYIAPYAPGGSSDIIFRLLQPTLERELGVPVNYVAKEGAGSQVGTTEIALAKPDGYTFGYTSLPTVNGIYLDPERKAAFGRKDLQALTQHSAEWNVLAVRDDSPFRTGKDLVDAAKANPGKVTISTSGVLSVTHMGVVQLEQVAGIDLRIVHFNGQGPASTALLGGHVDVSSTYVGNIAQYIKGGQMRPIAYMGPKRNKYIPDTPTMEELGIKGLDAPNIRGFTMPAGAPKEVVDTLAGALKRAQEDPTHIQKLEEQYYELAYASPEEFGKTWDEWDKKVIPLMEAVKKDAAQ